MIERLIAFAIVLAIFAFVMYRGVKNAEKQEKRYKYIFKLKHRGTNKSQEIKCNSLEDLRRHPVFDGWGSNYRLWQSNVSSTVKMVKDGEEYSTGFVMGQLRDIE